MTNWRKYVLWFAQEHVDFRYNVSTNICLHILLKYEEEQNRYCLSFKRKLNRS